MRCDGGHIQDKMPEGADLRNIIILYNMPLSNTPKTFKSLYPLYPQTFSSLKNGTSKNKGKL